MIKKSHELIVDIQFIYRITIRQPRSLVLPGVTPAALHISLTPANESLGGSNSYQSHEDHYVSITQHWLSIQHPMKDSQSILLVYIHKYCTYT